MDVKERAREWVGAFRPIDMNEHEKEGAKIIIDMLAEMDRLRMSKEGLELAIAHTRDVLPYSDEMVSYGAINDPIMALEFIQSQLSRYTNAVEVEGQIMLPGVIPNITLWLPFETNLPGFADGQRVKVLVMAEE